MTQHSAHARAMMVFNPLLLMGYGQYGGIIMDPMEEFQWSNHERELDKIFFKDLPLIRRYYVLCLRRLQLMLDYLLKLTICLLPQRL